MTKALPVTIEHGDYLESTDGAVTNKRYLKVICMLDTVFVTPLSITGSVTGKAHLPGPTYPAGTVIQGGIITGLEVASGQVFCVTGMSEVV